MHEASGGNVSSPATISYDYYPDGSREDVNVASAQVTANRVLAYAYRADGARTRATLNYANVQYSFGFAYTDGGRMTSRTDPFTNTVIPSPAAPVAAGSRYSPQSWTYDTTGQLTGLAVPYAYAYTGVSHDAEGHMVGWHTNVPSEGDVAMAFTNSVRGENVGSRLTTAAHGLISSSSVWLAHGSIVSPDIHSPTIDFLDPYNGVVTARHGYTQHDPYGDGVTTADCPSPNYIRDAYDRAGRMTMHDTMVYDSAPVSCNGEGWTDTYAYDAEDHTVTVDGACAAWGPDGHATVFSNVPCPAQPGPGVANDTLHYDGDTILFVTSVPPHNVSTSIRLEQLGALNIDSSGAHFTVGDREMTGNLVASHSDLGYTGIKFGTKVWQVHTPEKHGGGPSSTDTASIVIAPSTNGFPYGASFGPYTYVAPDGFTFNGKQFQGVRVMDPETGHWTTPDAYAGDVHDPMSQKPFMWNRNNPYEWADPSGFDTITIYARDADFGSLAHTFIEVVTDATPGHPSRRIRYSFGPSIPGLHLNKGKLVRQKDGYDEKYSGGTGTYDQKELAHCTGTCTKENGGFDEAKLDETAAAINRAGFDYGLNNSNSATYTLCVSGGGGGKCTFEPGWLLHGAFGWGRMLQSSNASRGK